MTKETVFVVDDDEAVRQSTCFMLRHAGYDTLAFEDGADFLQRVSPDDHGCVLLDVRMPGLDGLSVLERLVAKQITMPVIMLTGHGDVYVAMQAMKAGAVEFLEKPSTKQRLTQAIDRALSAPDRHAVDQDYRRNALSAIERLSSDELNVLKLLAQGHNNKAIAETLSVAPGIVERHKAHLMDKLQAETLSSTLRIAVLAGISTE